MEDWVQKNTFYIRYSLYSYIVTSASSGGAISSANTACSFFIDKTVFNNCSAQNRGGAFMISCKSFSFQRSCCSYCYCLIAIDYGWGHCGSATVSENGTVECSVVFKCAYQAGLGGHVSLDLENGIQTFDNLNATSCLSNGEVYAYGATNVLGSYCTFSYQDTAGFTLRNVGSNDVILSHFAFINNPSIGFGIDHRNFNNHNTVFEDSYFYCNDIDMSGNLITVKRCSTSKSAFSGVTVGDGCNTNVNIVLSMNEKFISNQCEVITIVGRDGIFDESGLRFQSSFISLIFFFKIII